jgi:flagellum-specific peptidoglycan hydrolase FlgJ
MSTTVFYDSVLPYAQRASKATDIPVSVVLAQWGIESAYGKSNVAKNNNNLGGIRYVKSSIAIGESESGYAKYKDYNQFVDDYIRVIKNGYYTDVINAVSPEDTSIKFGQSKYAGGKYKDNEGRVGYSLINNINSQGLKKYDSAETTSSTPLTLDDNTKKIISLGLVGLLIVMFFN